MGIGGDGGTSRETLNGTVGYAGENCGEVNIYDNLDINCFGGSGGTGGAVTVNGRFQSGGGGSGFPAARYRWPVGAGGTSGNTAEPGGGFGCGVAEYAEGIGGKDGKTLDFEQSKERCISGSYYETFAAFDFTSYKNYSDLTENDKKKIESAQTLWNYRMTDENMNELLRRSGGIGGGGVGRYFDGIWCAIPDCARAGKGGVVSYSSSCKIHAYNGSYITTKDSKDMEESERINSQALIYAQVGFNLEKVRKLFEVKKVVSRTADGLISEWQRYDNAAYRDIDYTPFTNYLAYENGSGYGLGIGSGAGGYQDKDGNGEFKSNLNH